MLYFILGAVGIVVGILIYKMMILVKPTHGTLKIDRSNPEKDFYRIEIDDLDSLDKKKRIILKVDTNADLSHK